MHAGKFIFLLAMFVFSARTVFVTYNKGVAPLLLAIVASIGFLVLLVTYVKKYL
jgi:hypothetical protein